MVWEYGSAVVWESRSITVQSLLYAGFATSAQQSVHASTGGPEVVYNTVYCMP